MKQTSLPTRDGRDGGAAGGFTPEFWRGYAWVKAEAARLTERGRTHTHVHEELARLDKLIAAARELATTSTEQGVVDNGKQDLP